MAGKTSEAQLEAVRRHREKNPVHNATVSFYEGTHDAEWEWLQSKRRKSEYVRALIRRDMAAHGAAPSAYPEVARECASRGWGACELAAASGVGIEVAEALLGDSRDAAGLVRMTEAAGVARALGRTMAELFGE